MPTRAPRRGEVWRVDLDPVQGHEQGRQRPAVIVSADAFNRSAAGMVVVCPMTRTDRRIPFHVRVEPPEGGLRAPSFVLCDQVRTIALERVRSRLGSLATQHLWEIEDRLRILLDL